MKMCWKIRSNHTHTQGPNTHCGIIAQAALNKLPTPIGTPGHCRHTQVMCNSLVCCWPAAGASPSPPIRSVCSPHTFAEGFSSVGLLCAGKRKKAINTLWQTICLCVLHPADVACGQSRRTCFLPCRSRAAAAEAARSLRGLLWLQSGEGS